MPPSVASSAKDDTPAAGDADKQDKDAVRYSVGGKDDCGDCQHYTALGKGVGSCSKVKGMIRPWMWCIKFKERAK